MALQETTVPHLKKDTRTGTLINTDEGKLALTQAKRAQAKVANQLQQRVTRLEAELRAIKEKLNL